MGDGEEQPRHHEHDRRLGGMGRTKAAFREKMKSRKCAATWARKPGEAFDQTDFRYLLGVKTKYGSEAQHSASKNSDAKGFRMLCCKNHETHTHTTGAMGESIHHPRGADKEPLTCPP